MNTTRHSPINVSRPSNRDQGGAKKPVTEPSAPSGEQTQPNHNDHGGSGSGQKKHWLEYLTAFLALIAAIGSVLAAGFSGWQAYVAQDTEKNQLAPYVAVSDFSVKCCDIDVVKPGYTETRKLATVTIKNGGQSAASSVSVSAFWTEYPKGSAFPTNISYLYLVSAGKAVVGPDGKISVQPATYYMLPGETKTMQVGVDSPAGLRTKAGISDMVFYGTIAYTDIFGRRRYTDFCRVWEVFADETYGYQECPEHNAARG